MGLAWLLGVALAAPAWGWAAAARADEQAEGRAHHQDGAHRHPPPHHLEAHAPAPPTHVEGSAPAEVAAERAARAPGLEGRAARLLSVRNSWGGRVARSPPGLRPAERPGSTPAPRTPDTPLVCDDAESVTGFEAADKGRMAPAHEFSAQRKERAPLDGPTSAVYTPPRSIFTAEPERQQQVRQAFVHAIDGYTAHAWGIDELDPINKVGLPSYGMGLTIVDSLDTMILMGLEEHFKRAIHWINHSLVFGDQQGLNVFEVNGCVLCAAVDPLEPLLA